MKKKGNTRGVKIFVIAMILVVLVVGYYIYMNNKVKAAKEEQTQVTAVQNVLLKDLERSYPATPKEVVRYFCDITMCFYNEEYSEEELLQMAEKIQGIYDEELKENKTQEQYLKDLKSEIAERKQKKCTISGYELSASTDVKNFTKDGHSCASLYATFRMKQDGAVTEVMEQFILRKDADGHWKIYGWEPVEEEAQ